MDAKAIIGFLKGIAANNNREWYAQHKAEYEGCRADFARGVEQAIAAISEFDPDIAAVKAKDCIYRFNRDIRFSPDKAPYKRHFGAYICTRGRKALRGGYYLHIEPGHCLVATGSYWLPTNILTSCRNEIMGNIGQWRSAVEAPAFVKAYGRPNEGDWEKSSSGFGLEALKTAPAGFPRDYEHIRYLRMKDYCCWRQVPDGFFRGDAWIPRAMELFRTAKPMMDFINSVIDDYE